MADQHNVKLAGTVSKAWLAQHMDVSFDRDYYFNLDKRAATDRACNAFVRERFPDLDLFYSESNLGRSAFWSDDMVLVGGIQPNMLLGMILGAEFFPQDDKDADIEMNFLAGKRLADLPSPASLLDTSLVREFDEQIEKLKKSSLIPIPPFFWDSSGRAVIHGPFTTALKFFSETFMLDAIDDPESVVDIIYWISECFAVLVNHFAEITDREITSLHIGECSGCMINAEMYADIVVKPAEFLGERIAPVRLHSCGNSNHLADACRAAAHVIAFDLGGGNKMNLFRNMFEHDTEMTIAPLVKDLTSPVPDGLLAWFAEKLEEMQGEPFGINYHLEPDYNIENIYSLAKKIERKS